MERIQAKAQRERAVENLQTLLDSVKDLPAGSPEREAAYIRALEGLVKKTVTAERQRKPWDFSLEKRLPIFVQDDAVIIRPMAEGDTDFYISTRMQYSMIYRVMIGMGEHSSNSLFLFDICQPESFYCVIENRDRVPIGYLGIKDTSAEIRELAIELDKQHTQHGFGPRSIMLFLNKVSCITGKTEFNAKVETDNIPSQKCFERIGAELVGLCDGPILKSEEEKSRFEENNMNLLGENMSELATRLGVESRKLLSHVLEYRMTCPL